MGAVVSAREWDAEVLARAAHTRVIGRDVRAFEEIDSTSSEARRMVERGEAAHGLVVAAARQTAGRGTGGKVWRSEGADGLWCTIVLMGEVVQPVSLAIGCAVVDAIGAVGGGAVAAHLKWPNDVLVGEGAAARKIAGILVETAHGPGVRGSAHLVGIGINVHQERFEGEVADRAASLRMCGVETDVPRVFGALMAAVERHLEDGEPVARRWIARTRMVDTSAVIVRGGLRSKVMVRGISADGRVVVEHADGRREMLASATDMDLVWPVGGESR